MAKTNSLPVLRKILNTSKEQAAKTIWSHYTGHGHTTVNFLYFANAMKYRLFEETTDTKSVDYKSAINKGDFLLPDGIALEVFYYTASRFHKDLNSAWPKNLNGTDFIPYFFNYLAKEKEEIDVAIYSTYDPQIGKSVEELEIAKINFKQRFNRAITFSYAQNYRTRDSFPLEEYKKQLNESNKKYRIFLTCIGTPSQEIRVNKNKDFFEKNNVLVFNAGGFVDFLSGFEKRAPQRVVKARVLETFWRIAKNPKKNFKKFREMFGIVRFLGKKVVG